MHRHLTRQPAWGEGEEKTMDTCKGNGKGKRMLGKGGGREGDTKRYM